MLIAFLTYFETPSVVSNFYIISWSLSYIYTHTHTLVYTTIQGTSLIWYGHLSDPKIPLNQFFKQRKNLGPIW